MLERHLAEGRQAARSFDLPGFCTHCRRAVDFVATFDGAWRGPDGILVPNWRECLCCPGCGLSGRQRRVIELVTDAIAERGGPRGCRAYLMETVSPIHRWARAAFPGLDLVASEYLGPHVSRVAPRGGIRNEDAEALTFPDAILDLFVSCDVFEHVNEPARAFREIARTLRVGGRAILTFPMDPNLGENRRRAELVGGEIRMLLPAIYHGNPLSPAGSLVYTDFGWAVLDQMRDAGLDDPTLNVYWSYEHGYLGTQFYFVAGRA